MKLHHIAMICSSERSLVFYESFGFKEESRVNRGYDIVVWMRGGGATLEIFIDSTHPARVTNPEAYGLRHIAFEVEDLETECENLRNIGYQPEEIRTNSDKVKFTFVKDPDGLPVELRENISSKK